VTPPRLFTIDRDFARTLAKGLIARVEAGDFALSDCVIYLPTRRAARGFGEAFATAAGGAALLPDFRALGDSDDDDPLFEALYIPPAIAPIRRQLLLAALIERWDPGRSVAQAAALAQSLAALMDEAETQGADLSNLERLAPAALAEHWQEVTRFLSLIRDQWPAILQAENCLNPAARRNLALELRTQRLAASPPRGMVIAAGSTGSIPATARLLRIIAGLPRGAVILPGLDRGLDEKSWHDLDPGHPQFGLKQLLDGIGAARADVADWHEAPRDPARALLLRETLRPAPTTDAWRALAHDPAPLGAGLDGIGLAEANDPAQEALVIALALRETLEHPGRTAALVTPDRNLARRVAGELTRWGIRIDDSAGRPLAHASAGAFLCLLTEAAAAGFAPVPLLALLKHPFATLGGEPAAFRARARELDRALRGPRPDPGLQGVARRLAESSLQQWWRDIAALLAPLEQAFAQETLALDALIEIHVAAAERLACAAEAECPLWRDQDGAAASQMIADFREAAKDLPPIAPRDYPALLRALAMAVPVRPRAGFDHAIAILGPLEARLLDFDLTILGGLNEGTWPAAAGADPWFSRPMRQALGLPQPERAIGQAAHDFAMLAAGRSVLLTRALKAEGAPTVASRWLQRLRQLTEGLGLTLSQSSHLEWARTMSEVAPGPRLERPAPRPPVAARPRRLTVTEIETWLRDPYAIYAKHVLKLRPLDPLDDEIGALERGSLFHRALELFVRDHPGGDLATLTALGDRLFAEAAIPHAQQAVWRPRFLNAARAFLDWERSRATVIASSHLEVRGRMRLDAPAGPFELACIADRIDMLKDGGAAIVDYKTGRLPDKKWLVRFLMPQLPLEGAILAADGFDGMAAQPATQLIYLRFAGKDDRDLVLEGTMAEEARMRLAGRIAWFDLEDTPYHSRIAPQNARIAGDYDHLARVREWSASGWSEE
jgi:ATP-dependent helicase/nuclease subunit B